MKPRRALALTSFVLVVIAGTAWDHRARAAMVPRSGTLLVADLHVHPYPGDGSLTVWQLQREAARRGVDVIAVTAHNNRAGLVLSSLFRTDANGVIVLPGQEVTAPDFHLIAAGTEHLVDWRLRAADAIAAIHAQGGVAIAAHPVSEFDAGWDEPGRQALDGSEVMHPMRLESGAHGRELDEFFLRSGEVNPAIAAIGSTDFHMTAPLGLCRTYLLTTERTAAGAIAAIRDGRTVAACGDGEVVGRPEHVTAVEEHLPSLPPGNPPGPSERLLALLGLLALAWLAMPTRAPRSAA